MRTLRFAAWPVLMVLVSVFAAPTARAECGGIFPATELNWTCDDLDRAGCCVDSTLVWCADSVEDVVCGLDCAINGVAPYNQCGWDPDGEWYNCGGDGADPSGDNPLACDWDCTPACDGLNCGPDGCGGTCGECGADQFCHDGVCGAPGACSSAGTLECTDGGDVVVGNTAADGLPIMNEYPGCSGRWIEDGQELAYTYVAPADMTVAFQLTPTDPDGTGPMLAPDLDLFLLEGSCDQLSCVARGEDAYVLGGDSDVLVFDVTAGTTYYVVVDGYDGDSGAFELRLECCTAAYYTPDCTGRSCGPAPGVCPGYSCGDCPICVDGVCELDYCCDVPPEGCCDGDTVRRCVNNRIIVEDCVALGTGGCGWWDGDGAQFDPGYYCGGEGEGGGLPMDCVYDAGCNAACDAEWECGQSETGEPCGVCADGEVCNDHACEPDVTCEAEAIPLTCNAERISFNGDTHDGSFLVDSYGGTCPAWGEEGPELVYAIEAQTSGIFILDVMPVGADLDVFVTADTCHGDFCISSGDTGASWTAVEGTTYYIIVDGYSGAQAPFSATLDCAACRPDCDGVQCGDDGCGGSCGLCGGADVCFEGSCCTPQCDSVECGDDGCGGTCGGCDTGAGETCFRGECVVYADYCDNLLGFAGCCDNGINVWCEDGLILQSDCAEVADGTCGWDSDLDSYVCGGNGSDPTTVHNIDCPWNRPTCEDEGDCSDGDANTADLCIDGVCDWRACQCLVAADCDDGDEYTIEDCVGCLCEYTPNRPCELGCDDEDPHTVDTCTPEGICEHEFDPDICVADHECFDADPCTDDYCCLGEAGDPLECGENSIEPLHCISLPSADADECCHGDDDPNCDDDDGCTVDLCRLTEDGPRCQHVEMVGCCRDSSDPDVDDLDPCTIDYCCMGAGDPIAECTTFGEVRHVQLTIGPPSEGGECCTLATHCDDFDVCTLDYCDTQTHTCISEDVEDTFPTDPETGDPLYQCCDPGNPERQCDPDGSACTDDLCLNYRCFYPRIAPDCCETGDDAFCDEIYEDRGPCWVNTCCNEGDERPECVNAPYNPVAANRCGSRAWAREIDDPDFTYGDCCENDAQCDDDDCCTNDLCCQPDDPRPECFNQPDNRCINNDRRLIEECCCAAEDPFCDDGNDCTADSCNVGDSLCEHEPIVGCCTGGDDSFADDECCTRDWCDCDGEECAEGETGLIRHTPYDCDDDNACTEDECQCAATAEGYECVNTDVSATMCPNGECDPETGECSCEPNCEGKDCGEDDGCGNECFGDCDADHECSEVTDGDFECVPIPVEHGPDVDAGGTEDADAGDLVKPDVQPDVQPGEDTEPVHVDDADGTGGDSDVAEEKKGGGGGCDCTTGSNGSVPPSALFFVLLLGVLVLRRRRA